MILVQSTHPGWLSNAYLVAAREGGDAVMIDSGAPLGTIREAIESLRLRLRAVLTTHRHPDHVAGHPEVRSRTGAAIPALRGEAEHVDGAEPLDDGQELVLQEFTVRVLHLPGHTPFHAGYFIEGSGLFVGDALFAGSVGSTLRFGPSGFAGERWSLVERVLGFPDGTPVLPGHGAATTVGRERSTNPFLRVLTGLDPEGVGPCTASGRAARLIVLARDFDGRTKAWVRFEDDSTDAILPGNRVECHRGVPRGADAPRPSPKSRPEKRPQTELN